MPLSEHEQRQLEQIEQSLYADYPKLAQAVRARDPRVHYKRRVVQAAFLFLVGVGLLLAGVVSRHFLYISIAGFVVMLFSAMWGLNSWRHMGGITSGRGFGANRGQMRGADKRRRRRQADSGFMERLEERWRRRQEGGGRGGR